MCDGRMELHSNGPGPITKTVVMPVYGKHFKQPFFFRTTELIALRFDM